MTRRGKIRTGIFVLAAVTVLGVGLSVRNMQAAEAETTLSYVYQRAVNDLSGYVSGMENALEKVRYANTATAQTSLAAQLLEESSGAKAALAALPVSGENSGNINRFLAQSGDYASYLSRRLAAGSTLKWGANADTQDNGWTFTTVDDQANAGLSEGADGGIAFANAGWYALQIAFSIEDNSVRAKLTVYPGTAYVTGHVAAGAWNDPDPNWALTAPADASGEWVSPAFATGGELRAYIKIPETQWWQTEFTLYDGNLYFRNANIVDSWSEIGSDYAVTCTAGQKLYVDFDNDMGRVE